MNAFKKFRRSRSRGEADVNITSLMDVLTVLLFFLIQSSTSTTFDKSFDDKIQLPASYVKVEPNESIRISVSEDQLFVNEEPLIKLAKGRFPASVLEEDKRTVKPLQELFVKEKKKRDEFFKEVAADNNGKLPPLKVMIVADKKLKFQTVKYILHTAAITGFEEYQFLTKPPGK